MNRARQKGLTLPELLIALVIFSFISAAAVYALRIAVEGREQLSIADKAIREFQVSRLVMKEDLAQIALRPTRDEFGDARRPAFAGGAGVALGPPKEGEKVLLAFVRRGWDNPDAEAPRPTLQAVEYIETGGRLVRRTRPYLDDARGQPRHDRTLMSGVETAAVQFLGGETSAGLTWVELWPSAQGGGFVPKAVKLTLTTRSFGVVEQWFWIGEIAP
jgi:general secretion pathway protein J